MRLTGSNGRIAPFVRVSYLSLIPSITAGGVTEPATTSVLTGMTPQQTTVTVSTPTGQTSSFVSVIRIPVPPGTTFVSSISLPRQGSGRGFVWTPAAGVDIDSSGSLVYYPLRNEEPEDLFMNVPTPTGYSSVPASGTFVYDRERNEVLVFVDSSDPIFFSGMNLPLLIESRRVRVETVGSLPAAPVAATNRITSGLPSLFTKFPLQGAVRVSLSFEGQPSGAFAFEVPGNYRQNIECDLKPGKVLSLFGIDLRVASLSIEQQSLNDYPTGMLVVSVSLGGFYNEKLSAPIPYLGSGTGAAGETVGGDFTEEFDPDCALPGRAGGGAASGMLGMAQSVRSEAFIEASVNTNLSKAGLDQYPTGYTFQELADLLSVTSKYGTRLYIDTKSSQEQIEEIKQFRAIALPAISDPTTRQIAETQSSVFLDFLEQRIEIVRGTRQSSSAIAQQYGIAAAKTAISKVTNGVNAASSYSAAGGKRGQRKYISLSALARKGGISYQGPDLKIPIPENATKNDATSFSSHVTEAMRIAGCFIDYTTKTIRGLSWTSTRSFSYSDDDIFGTVETSIQAMDETTDSEIGYGSYVLPAIDTTSPFPSEPRPIPRIGVVQENQACIPYGAKYCRVRLTGEFLNIEQEKEEEEEKTKSKLRNEAPPQWKQMRLPEVWICGGDSTPGNPPALFPETEDGLPDISICGQQTKTVTCSRMVGGLPVYEETEVWGFEGYLDQWVDWVVVSQTHTYHRYDSGTGYYLGWDKYGWQSVQLVSESPGDPLRDTRYLDRGGYTGQWRRLIQFSPAPLQGAERYFIVTFSRYYGNVSEAPLVPYKQCLEQKSVTKYAADPNYVEPAFAEVVTRVEQSYLEGSHPDTTPSDPLPPFGSGCDLQFRQKITVDPAVYDKITTAGGLVATGQKDQPGFSGATFGNPLKPDTYTTYTAEEQSQGMNFENFARNNRFQDSIGRPGTHTRMQKQYARVPPPGEEEADKERNPRKNNKRTRSYYLMSPGCPIVSRVETGSKNYSYADTLAEAERAAQTDLWIDDFRNALSGSLSVPFDASVRPGDRATVRFAGVEMYRRISGVEWSFELHGWVDGVPFVTADPMKLSVGIDRRGGPQARVVSELDPKPDDRSDTPGADDLGDEDDKPPSHKNDRFDLGSILPVTVFNNSRY